MKILIMQLFQLPVTSSFFSSNIFFSILSLNTLSPYLSIHLSDQIVTPMQTAGKIIRFHILIFLFYR